MKRRWWLNGVLFLYVCSVQAGTYNPGRSVAEIRTQVLKLEDELVQNVKASRSAGKRIQTVRQLLALQNQERELGKKRIEDLEKTVSELEKRKLELRARMETQRMAIRRSLTAIDAVPAHQAQEEQRNLNLPEQEKLEAPKRRVLANLVERGIREIELLRADLQDSEQIEQKISEERQQLVNLMHDLQEQEGVLKFNQQLQSDLMRRARSDRIDQLENYRKLKNAQAQVEQMMTDFNARKELERTLEQQRQDAKLERQLDRAPFAALRGRLQLPVSGGKIVSVFGRGLDPRSRLQIFKKGIEVSARANDEVRAIFAGKIAYSGELPDYGKVTIVDHGGHYYTLMAHLGRLGKKAGQVVNTGDSIGQADDAGTPVYFEIRAKNVPVNPLQWLAP